MAGVAESVSAMCGVWGVGNAASRPRPPGPRFNFPSEKVFLTIKYLFPAKQAGLGSLGL